MNPLNIDRWFSLNRQKSRFASSKSMKLLRSLIWAILVTNSCSKDSIEHAYSDLVSGSQVFRFHYGLTDFKTIRDNLTSVTLPQCIEACEKDSECNFFTFQADKLGDCRTSHLALMNNSSMIPSRLYEKVKPNGLLVEFSELLARGKLGYFSSVHTETAKSWAIPH